MIGDARFDFQDSICRQVSNRMPHIQEFSSQHELTFFVAGGKSSNGKVLFSYCQKGNERSIFVSSPDEIQPEMLQPLPTEHRYLWSDLHPYVADGASRQPYPRDPRDA